MASANRDNKLVSVRAHFGMWGIGVYWTLIEFVAEQVKEKSEKVEATLIISDLLGFFGCKRNKLEMFLEYCANIPRTFPEHSSNIPRTFPEHSPNDSLFTYTLEGNILKIEIEKMLKYADNYIKYEGKSLKTLQRQYKLSLKQDKNRIEEDKNKNIKSTDTTFSIPKYLNNPDFVRTFHEFVAHRKEIKKPLTQRAGDKLLKKLCLYSCNDAIKMLDQSIENSWQGVFELKGNGNGNTSKNNSNSAIARATFQHGEDEKRRLRELQATLEEHDRIRNERTGAN